MRFIKGSVRAAADRALDFISPCVCMCCGVGACPSGVAVCSGCTRDFYNLLTARCPDCGLDTLSCSCGSVPPVALFFYGPALSKRIIGVIKNNADTRYVRFLALLLSDRVGMVKGKRFDFVAFVPRRGRGVRKAGYDQAKLLAGHIADGLGIPLVTAIKRQGSVEQKFLSASQRKKSIKERYSLIQNAFGGKPPGRILLIDDVYTTGATAEFCASLLRRAGADAVITAVLAKTPKSKAH